MNTKERCPQLKTIELLIVYKLQQNTPDSKPIRESYEYTRNHFADEDFLHGCQYKDLIEAIYLKDFYKNHTVRALELHFHLDTKTLLEVRKSYLQLFSKHFLSLDENTKNYRILLYHALINEENPPSIQR